MTRTYFKVFSDHHQYWIQDESESDPDSMYEHDYGLVAVQADGHGAAVFCGAYYSVVAVTVDVLDSAPEPELDAWEDVEEVSMALTGPSPLLTELYEDEQGQDPSGPPAEEWIRLPAADGETRTYRVRVHARGHGRAAAAEEQEPAGEADDDPLIEVEQHLIQIWPAPRSAQIIWKHTHIEPATSTPYQVPPPQRPGRLHYWLKDDSEVDLETLSLRGGLVGAQADGHVLTIRTITYVGELPITVNVCTSAPAPGPGSWDEVEETSMTMTGDTATFVFPADLAGPDTIDLPAADDQTRTYRVRVHLKRPRDDDAEEQLIQIWPEEKASTERRARLEAERQAETDRLAEEMHRWGGRLPNKRLRSAGGHAQAVAELDFELAEAVSLAAPDTQRSIARWATRRAYTVAGLADIDWIAPALEALDQGRALPPPFDDPSRLYAKVWDRLFNDPRVPQTTVVLPGGGIDNFLQQAAAVPALFGAAEPDPLQAAFDALHAAAAAFGDDAYHALFQELRATFQL